MTVLNITVAGLISVELISINKCMCLLCCSTDDAYFTAVPSKDDEVFTIDIAMFTVL